jgi:hypothetical protein
MVKWRRRENTTPNGKPGDGSRASAGLLSEALPEWVEEQLAVTTLHEIVAQANQTDGSVAQIVGLPTAR